MTPSQKVALAVIETREKLNLLLVTDDRSTEQESELKSLTAKMMGLEVEARAAIAAEPSFIETVTEGSPEDIELRELASGADLGAIMTAALEHRSTAGRERELQDHFKLNSNQVPLAMLESRAVTPAPSAVGESQSAIIPGVFPMSAAAFMNVDMPTVGVGEVVYPVLKTNATVHVPAKNAAAEDTTGAFDAEVLSPGRLQAAFFYAREDRARFAGMDEALRMNLSDALSDGLDKQIIVGTNGLLTGTNLDAHNVSAVTSYALYRSQFGYGRVDGRYASSIGDLKILMGSATYGHASGKFRSDNAGDRAALEDLQSVTGGVRVSAHVPGVSSHKQNAVIRLGSRRDMVAPVWEGVTLIPDEVTMAKNGQIIVTAVMLHAVKILRKAGFYKQQAQHA